MTETVKGTVQAISAKPNKNHMGLLVDLDSDTPNSEEWFNGNDEDIPSMSEGDKIELVHDDNWISKINVLEEDNGDGAQSREQSSDSGMGSGSSNAGSKTSSHNNPKRANIQATAATKKAADIVAEHRTTEPGEFEEEVSVVASGLNRIMNKLYEENME